MIQYGFFKLTKKRVFWIVQFAFAVVGFVLYYFTLYNGAV